MKDGSQVVFFEKDKVINEVITLREASEILGCADSTLRNKVLNNKFSDGEYRKAYGVILFNKDVIDKLYNEKMKK